MPDKETIEEIAQTIIDVRAGGRVDRLHTVHKTRPYSVAEHSWNIWMLIHQLDPSVLDIHLTQYIMFHDVAEHWVGDVPAPVKWMNPAMGHEYALMESEIAHKLTNFHREELSEYQHELFKFCDMLDLLLFCREEEWRGNRELQGIQARAFDYLKNRNIYWKEVSGAPLRDQIIECFSRNPITRELRDLLDTR